MITPTEVMSLNSTEQALFIKAEKFIDDNINEQVASHRDRHEFVISMRAFVGAHNKDVLLSRRVLSVIKDAYIGAGWKASYDASKGKLTLSTDAKWHKMNRDRDN